MQDLAIQPKYVPVQRGTDPHRTIGEPVHLLEVQGIAYELREVVLKDKPAVLLAASPKGTVPVLVLATGDVLDESLGIMLWALRQNDPACWLEPQRASITDMLALIAGNDGAFKQHLDRYKYPHRYTQASGGDSTGFAAMHRAQAACWLAELEGMLGDGCLFGSATSLADMALLPFVRQFAHTDAAWFAAQPWPRLQVWLAGFEVDVLYGEVMEKYPVWVPRSGTFCTIACGR